MSEIILDFYWGQPHINDDDVIYSHVTWPGWGGKGGGVSEKCCNYIVDISVFNVRETVVHDYVLVTP